MERNENCFFQLIKLSFARGIAESSLLLIFVIELHSFPNLFSFSVSNVTDSSEIFFSSFRRVSMPTCCQQPHSSRIFTVPARFLAYMCWIRNEISFSSAADAATCLVKGKFMTEMRKRSKLAGKNFSVFLRKFFELIKYLPFSFALINSQREMEALKMQLR